MARTLQMKLEALGGDEVAAAYAVIETSLTATGVFAQVGTDIDLSLLTPDGDGYYTLSTDANDVDFVKVAVKASVSGDLHYASQILGPKPASASLVTVEVFAKDLGMTVIAGLKFTATPEGGIKGSSGSTYLQTASATTDAAGYAALTLPADSGVTVLALEDFSAEFDTTGTGGTSVNFGDII